LNGRLGRSLVSLNGQASYALWKDLCLGVYHPICFPNTFPSGGIVHFGGGGGENHRPFYSWFLGAPSADTFVARRTQNIVLPSARRGFEVALQQAVDRITDGSPEHLDALACHYRHFRNRFHFGREPQYTVTVQPLSSKLLDGATALAGRSRFLDAQIHYDVLHHLVPELLDMPFDSRRKRPGYSVRRNLTSITACPLPSGSCFIGDSDAPPEEVRRGSEGTSAIDLLHDEFGSAETGLAAVFLGKAYIRRAQRGLQSAARKGRFSGPIRSKRVAVVMACGLFKSRQPCK
jgi:hypothetical protein